MPQLKRDKLRKKIGIFVTKQTKKTTKQSILWFKLEIVYWGIFRCY